MQTPSRSMNSNNTGSGLSGIATNSVKFLADTVAIAKLNPMAGGGRCIGVGVAGVAGGAVIAAAGTVAETLGMAGMVLGGVSMMCSQDQKSGLHLFMLGAMTFAAGSVAQVVGTVAIVGGGASVVAGTGLVAYGVQHRSASAPSATNPVSSAGPSDSIPNAASMKNRLRITVAGPGTPPPAS